MLEQLKEIQFPFFYTSFDAAIIGDADGNICMFNKVAEDIFGYEEQEVKGKSIAMLMPERYREAHTAGIKRMKSTHVVERDNKVLVGTILTRKNQEYDALFKLMGFVADENMYVCATIRKIL